MKRSNVKAKFLSEWTYIRLQSGKSKLNKKRRGRSKGFTSFWRTRPNKYRNPKKIQRQLLN